MASAADVERKVRHAITTYLNATRSASRKIIPPGMVSGKLYEAFALAEVLRQLRAQEGYFSTLVNGNRLKLRGSPGPINRNQFAYVEIRDLPARQPVAELWTDIEVTGLTHDHAPVAGAPPTRSEYHELDLVVVDLGSTGRPHNNEVWLGIECKNTTFKKRFLREILGVRRELSYLRQARPSRFTNWPGNLVPADPASWVVFFAADSRVSNYTKPGDQFGILFEHLTLP